MHRSLSSSNHLDFSLFQEAAEVGSGTNVGNYELYGPVQLDHVLFSCSMYRYVNPNFQRTNSWRHFQDSEILPEYLIKTAQFISSNLHVGFQHATATDSEGHELRVNNCQRSGRQSKQIFLPISPILFYLQRNIGLKRTCSSHPSVILCFPA